MPGKFRVRRGSPFWDRVDKSGDCWIWIGARVTAGYGEYRGKYAHRMALEEALGAPIPPKMLACHTCDNPPCVNPAHLYVGSQRDNSRDAVARGQVLTGERHPFARLTVAGVLAIRAAAAAGATSPVLARQFGVSPRQIRTVVARKAWRHVREARPVDRGEPIGMGL